MPRPKGAVNKINTPFFDAIAAMEIDDLLIWKDENKRRSRLMRNLLYWRLQKKFENKEFRQFSIREFQKIYVIRIK